MSNYFRKEKKKFAGGKISCKALLNAMHHGNSTHVPCLEVDRNLDEVSRHIKGTNYQHKIQFYHIFSLQQNCSLLLNVFQNFFFLLFLVGVQLAELTLAR